MMSDYPTSQAIYFPQFGNGHSHSMPLQKIGQSFIETQRGVQNTAANKQLWLAVL